MTYGNITDVPGIKVGNVEDTEAMTGCSVIVSEDGAVCGVDIRGAAPGTRETALLNPVNAVEQVHAITLSGGSAFGLAAADGVMHYLEEQGIGLDVGVTKVPIVPAAILFDLAVGDGNVRPDKKMGYQAAKQAKKGAFTFGNVGAGCGATVGKLTGMEQCMKGGLGSASVELENGVIIGALVAVNAVGDIRHPESGEILAGPIDPNTQQIVDSITYMQKNQSQISLGMNTTLGVVAANVSLTKAEATKISQVAHNALAKTIYPAHTMLDGDTIFTLATGNKRASVDLIGAMAVKVVEEAIVQAVITANSVGNIPSYKTFKSKK
ncbi:MULTISPECIES: P1 family peptidase [Virgibacillus]|uniref:Peptidase S58 n=1 Tax=Virgibacillus pantothenticus TaxID=1473 RepID=A0A0L0QV88_VIRPA|nr:MULTISPECIES: P1 family peptidase [Virgibacillus]API90921.1 peptidase S58 [Virgibacillus sp. 6R]KNE22118.1 peptidase S58 [Virgibacillus pantothenticus]MBS7428894.1 P1 family peptidase [Virgibacillus sp. 19R1-5]MBU8568708.1 P1 family peptidase [Virgibacillus pantothenticus]MBU8602689.1 P1 family peptidase [Virgibacillus pantothenticus]